MTGRSDSPGDEPDNGSRSARLIFVGALALAVAATAVLVLTSNPQWLRLGVLAALWAALLGAFLAMKYRKEVAEREDDVAELQSVYELELEREVAARREYELEIEAETRRRIEEEGRDDLAALRAELQALRENLDRLTGGEVLVERIALRAQSTRMRSFGGADPDSRRLTAEPSERRSITASPNGVKPNGNRNERDRRRVVEPPPTELIDPAILAGEEPNRRPAREPARPPAYRPEPVRPANRRAGSVVVEQPEPKRPERQVARRVDGRPDPAAQPPTRPAMPPAPAAKQPRPTVDSMASHSADLSQRLEAKPSGQHGQHSQPEGGGGRRRAEDRPAGERTVVAHPPALAESRHTSHERRTPDRSGPPSERHARRAHAQPEPQPTEPPPPALAVESEPTGAHAGGVSVTELLAAHAGPDGPPRRRRRAN